MKLSLAFITYNRKNEMLTALNSCIPYLTNDMEVVIVDNHSSDDSQILIKQYLDKNHINYIYEYSEQNLGVAGGRNRAFELSNSEYVFFLDDDAIVITEDIFHKVCDFMDHNLVVAALGLNIYEPGSDTYLLSHFKKVKNINYSLAYSFVGCAHVLRKSFYRPLGNLYPQGLVFGSEEIYASFKAWNEGKKIAYIPELVVHHMPSKINRYSGKDRDINFMTNIYIIKKMLFPKYVFGIVKLVFAIRILKNNLWKKEWRNKIKKYANERYDKNQRYKISTKTILFLLRTFKPADIL